jgi:hypothetical protein
VARAPKVPNFKTGNPEAEALMTDLEHLPHAFVIGCLMDRQIKAEKAWQIPLEIQRRLGTLAFPVLAKLTKRDWARVFSKPTPLHRFNDVMTEIARDGVALISQRYSGRANKIWSDRPSSATLVLRFLEFNGAGPKIATMAANILVRDFRVPVTDRYSIDVSPDVQVLRVFKRLGLIRSEAANAEAVYVARSLNPEYPGIFDFVAWDLGRNSCFPRKPACNKCTLRSVCPSAGKVA